MNYNDPSNEYYNDEYSKNDVVNSSYKGGYYNNPANSEQDDWFNNAQAYDMTANRTVDLSRVNFQENVLTQSFVFMALALCITAFASWYTYNSPTLFYTIFTTPGLLIGLLIGEFVLVMVNGYTARRNMVVPSAILFTLYCVVNGVTISSIFFVYTRSSIVSTFFITAAMFGVMAFIGLVTKIDLTRLGSLLLMGLIGIIIAGVVNMLFLHSTGFELAISVIGILIFVGLTAYDTQKIKLLAETTPLSNVTCVALLGATELYLDFINLFLKLLQLFGRRRN